MEYLDALYRAEELFTPRKLKPQIEKVGRTDSVCSDRSEQQIPTQQNYNPRSMSSAVVRVYKATSSEDEVTIANGFKLGKLSGDGTDDID